MEGIGCKDCPEEPVASTGSSGGTAAVLPSERAVPAHFIVPRGRGIRDARSPGVQGAITGRDVLVHSFTILRLWGPTVYIRCLRAVVRRRRCTFLGVLAEER
jgi:hypothetical protein